MMTLADAINRAGSTEPEKLRTALVQTNLGETDTIMPWEGIRFDSKGQNILTRGIFIQTQRWSAEDRVAVRSRARQARLAAPALREADLQRMARRRS